jgi:hypothetical protein
LDGSLKGRVPRQLWTLPWAEIHHPGTVAAIRKRFPPDLVGAPFSLLERLRTRGEQHGKGTYTDEWGAVFLNLQDGVIGEVRDPAISDWDDLGRVRIPEERLTLDRDQVNAFCRETDCFVLSPTIARPFERLQFLRGTANLYVDLMDRPEAMERFLRQMHEFYLREIELWANTGVDALMFMDDWGAQRALLIDPALWRQLFKPLYRDYIAIAHDAGKRAFMHSDGNILAIIPDLIELGLDALNSQIFCMGLANLRPFCGGITFWGEVDRQHLLARASTEEVVASVGAVYEALFDHGKVIAQCEFGAGARPENVAAVFETWDRITG